MNKLLLPAPRIAGYLPVPKKPDIRRRYPCQFEPGDVLPMIQGGVLIIRHVDYKPCRDLHNWKVDSVIGKGGTLIFRPYNTIRFQNPITQPVQVKADQLREGHVIRRRLGNRPNGLPDDAFIIVESVDQRDDRHVRPLSCRRLDTGALVSGQSVAGVLWVYAGPSVAAV